MSDEHETLKALRRLAHSMVWVEAPTEGSSKAKILCMRSGQRRDIGHIGSQTWRQLMRSGLVVSEMGNPYWRISNAGRLKVRRALSQTHVTIKKSSAPKNQASHPPGSSRSQKGEVSLLHWLRQRRDRSGRPFISDAEFQAGERLQADFTRGQLTPRVTSNWAVVGSVGGKVGPDAELSLSEAATDARQRVRDALQQVGPEFAGVLLDVCCFLQGLEDVERKVGWPQRSGKVVLKLALSALARHYGLEQKSGAAAKQNSEVCHWGAEGYQPTIDQW